MQSVYKIKQTITVETLSEVFVDIHDGEFSKPSILELKKALAIAVYPESPICKNIMYFEQKLASETFQTCILLVLFVFSTESNEKILFFASTLA